ncbi:DUF885 domain-containing protein [Haliea sp. E17]|uniref:DUF885 domain-containing protein n=1 Tax=Haliea sp. E17 TaxID=3401576 RepID=UPI003AAD5A35
MKFPRIILPAVLAVALPVHADWVERSDAITLELMRAQGPFAPEERSSVGLAQFDPEVMEISESARRAELAVNREQIQRLSAMLETEQDSRVRQDVEILVQALQRANTTSELEHQYLLPFVDVHDLVFGSINSLLDPRVAAERRPAVLERLRKYNGRAPGYQPITEMARQFSSERFGVAGLVGPYRGAVENAVEKAPLVLDGLHTLLAESELSGWEDDYALLAQQLEAYTQWLRDSMLPRAREENRLPPALYANALKEYGVDMSPQALIAQGQYSYQLLRSQMQVLAAEIAQQRNWEQRDLLSVLAALKAEQLAPEQVLPTYLDTLEKLEAIIRRENIVSLPERAASIREATAAESAAMPASYMSPPQLVNNTGQYGEFVLVQKNPALGESSQMDDFSHAAYAWTLTIHEVRPGHELQFSSMVEEGVSLARATYAFNSANAEGWALYAESVMLPYLPPEGQLFALHSLSWRAARMFLDPMVNTGQLSRDGARDFLMRELLMSEPMASSEADRYAYRMPGQATSYYFGFVTLMGLRTELSMALGERFNQMTFHDFILQQGLLPPDMLREEVRAEFLL